MFFSYITSDKILDTLSELKDLLKFTTGEEMLPSTGIMVDVCSTSDGIYASTCLCEVICPQAMSEWEYGGFRGGLLAAVIISESIDS